MNQKLMEETPRIFYAALQYAIKRLFVGSASAKSRPKSKKRATKASNSCRAGVRAAASIAFSNRR